MNHHFHLPRNNRERINMQPSDTTIPPPAQHSRTRRQHTDIEELYDIIYDYNRNIRQYNQNINVLITQLTQLYGREQHINHANVNEHNNNTSNPFTNITNRYRNLNEPIVISFDLPLTLYENDSEENYDDSTENVTQGATNINNVSTIRREYRRLRDIIYRDNDSHTLILTEEEIQNNIQDISFTEDLVGYTDPISLEEFTESDQLCKIISCGHIFKKNQLLRWFRRNSNCPVCRRQLQSGVGIGTTTENTEENQRNINQNSRTTLSSLLSHIFTNILDVSFDNNVVFTPLNETTRNSDRARTQIINLIYDTSYSIFSTGNERV